MAFTKNPTADTYSTQRIQLTREINSRAGTGSTDEDYVNCFIEPVKSKSAKDTRHYIIKRAGASQQVASVAASTVRGSIFWADQAQYFYCVDNDVYVYNVNTGATTTLSNPFSTSSGYVGMCEYLYDNNTSVICITDGTTLIQVDSAGTVTTCADGDLPSPHLPYPVFIDGYLLLVDATTADVYNSDLNDPMAWTTGNFFTAEMEGDLIVRIAKLNNYVVVFGTESIEYFWDAGLSPGSPFQRNDTPIKNASYTSGLAQVGNELFFLGYSQSGQPDLFKLKDFKIESVGTPTINKYLAATSDGASNWIGGIVCIQGHTFYVVNAGTTKTYVYDVDNDLWCRWEWKATSTFPITNSNVIKSNTKIYTYFTLAGALSTIYRFDETLYQDNGTNFTTKLITETQDFDTMNRKTMSRVTLVCDDPGSDSTAGLSWSDDDYVTFATARDINLHQDMPSTHRLGSFRQRAFKLTYTDNFPFRIEELEVDINKGNT